MSVSTSATRSSSPSRSLRAPATTASPSRDIVAPASTTTTVGRPSTGVTSSSADMVTNGEPNTNWKSGAPVRYCWDPRQGPVAQPIGQQPVLSRATQLYQKAQQYSKLGTAAADKKMIHCLHQSAQLGHADSQFHLGVLHDRGEHVPRDLKRAAQYYQQAAVQRHPDALNCLGFCFETGQGVVRDPERAIEYFIEAAELGHVDALHNLAVCYESSPELFEHRAGFLAKIVFLLSVFQSYVSKKEELDTPQLEALRRQQMQALQLEQFTHPRKEPKLTSSAHTSPQTSARGLGPLTQQQSQLPPPNSVPTASQPSMTRSSSSRQQLSRNQSAPGLLHLFPGAISAGDIGTGPPAAHLAVTPLHRLPSTATSFSGAAVTSSAASSSFLPPIDLFTVTAGHLLGDHYQQQPQEPARLSDREIGSAAATTMVDVTIPAPVEEPNEENAILSKASAVPPEANDDVTPQAQQNRENTEHSVDPDAAMDASLDTAVVAIADFPAVIPSSRPPSQQSKQHPQAPPPQYGRGAGAVLDLSDMDRLLLQGHSQRTQAILSSLNTALSNGGTPSVQSSSRPSTAVGPPPLGSSGGNFPRSALASAENRRLPSQQRPASGHSSASGSFARLPASRPVSASLFPSNNANRRSFGAGSSLAPLLNNLSSNPSLPSPSQSTALARLFSRVRVGHRADLSVIGQQAGSDPDAEPFERPKSPSMTATTIATAGRNSADGGPRVRTAPALPVLDAGGNNNNLKKGKNVKIQQITFSKLLKPAGTRDRFDEDAVDDNNNNNRRRPPPAPRRDGGGSGNSDSGGHDSDEEDHENDGPEADADDSNNDDEPTSRPQSRSSRPPSRSSRPTKARSAAGSRSGSRPTSPRGPRTTFGGGPSRSGPSSRIGSRRGSKEAIYPEVSASASLFAELSSFLPNANGPEGTDEYGGGSGGGGGGGGGGSGGGGGGGGGGPRNSKHAEELRQKLATRQKSSRNRSSRSSMSAKKRSKNVSGGVVGKTVTIQTPLDADEDKENDDDAFYFYSRLPATDLNKQLQNNTSTGEPAAPGDLNASPLPAPVDNSALADTTPTASAGASSTAVTAASTGSAAAPADADTGANIIEPSSGGPTVTFSGIDEVSGGGDGANSGNSSANNTDTEGAPEDSAASGGEKKKKSSKRKSGRAKRKSGSGTNTANSSAAPSATTSPESSPPTTSRGDKTSSNQTTYDKYREKEENAAAEALEKKRQSAKTNAQQRRRIQASHYGAMGKKITYIVCTPEGEVQVLKPII